MGLGVGPAPIEPLRDPKPGRPDRDHPVLPITLAAGYADTGAPEILAEKTRPRKPFQTVGPSRGAVGDAGAGTVVIVP